MTMIAEMTPGSNQAHHPGSRRGLEKKKKPRAETIFSRSKTRDRKNLKSPTLVNHLKFCFKDPETMEPAESRAELVEGKLRELTSKWFIETQAPLIVHNGLFPSWFLGSISRRDAEEILREKEPGCFLLRLSGKAIGYILSYKGSDRCRHFVINQNKDGQFVVCGDDREHDSLPELIEYYKSRPIQPFGEFLTSSCCEVLSEEVYDVIQISPEEKPAASVRTGKNMQCQHYSERPRAQPPKNNRTPEEVPPLPQRSWLLGAGAAHDRDRLLYARLGKLSPRQIPRSQHTGGDPVRPERSTSLEVSRHSPPSSSPSSSSSSSSSNLLLERRSPDSTSSLSSEAEHRLGTPPHTPPRLSRKPVRQLADAAPRPRSPEMADAGAIYHLLGEHGGSGRGSPSAERHSESVYAGVPQDDTYEQIPAPDLSVCPNYYEPLEDVRPKVIKSEKWKWLFPDAKRKW